MSSRTAAKEFECYARDCVKLAEQADTPELREELLQQAREWMRAVMGEEDADPAQRGEQTLVDELVCHDHQEATQSSRRSSSRSDTT